LKKYGYLDNFTRGTMTWSNASGSENRIGLIGDPEIENPYIRLYYTLTDNSTGEKKDIDYKVYLTSSRCNFGGQRYWFICPLFKDGISCQRRVGVLYKGGDYFGCRDCYNLTYRSRNESRSSKYAIFDKYFKNQEKIEVLAKEIKRFSYAGRPTKKYLKFNNLKNEIDCNSRALLQSMK
jgi:hypothetical protein